MRIKGPHIITPEGLARRRDRFPQLLLIDELPENASPGADWVLSQNGSTGDFEKIDTDNLGGAGGGDSTLAWLGL